MLLNSRYRLTRLLKGGGGVETWLGEDTTAPGRSVVVKLVDTVWATAGQRTRLEHEAAVLARLARGRDEGPLLAHGQDAGRIWLVQPFVPGRSLADRLAEGPLSPAGMLVVATDVLRALQRAHQLGVLHRDVKPANVIVQGDAAIESATLVDFGLARTVPLDDALLDEVVGTARYVAPEQAGLVDHVVDERSDLYSLGVVLYECLAGHPPFRAGTVGEVLRQHLNLAVPGLRAQGIAVPRALEAVVFRLLGKDPGQRYQSAEAALVDVEEIAAGLARGITDPAVVIGLHDRRTILTEPAFVGRGAELATLSVRAEEAAAGGGGLVLVASESGGGKTRLLDELAGTERTRAWILRGQGVDQAAQRPFELLEGVAAAVATAAQADPALGARLRDCLGDRAEAVAVALPTLAGVLGRDESDRLPEAHGEARTLTALAALLDALGTPDRPALVLLDDCQWTDGLTAKLLARWQHEAAVHGSHVLTVAAFRSEDAGPTHPVRRIGAAATLLLRPLHRLEVRDLAESMAGPLPDEAVDIVVELAEGSPFMAAAVVRGLVECGALTGSPTGWRIDREALADVQTSRRAALFLVRRLQLLSPDARRLLSTGAVLGKEFDLALAMDLAHQGPEQALPALAEARRRRIVWADEDHARCQFLHDKLRESLLDGLAPAERTALHRRAAQRIEQLDPGRIFELAYHYDAAGDLDRALPYAVAAAEHARHQHTLELAEAHYRTAARAAAADSDLATRAEVAEGLGDVLTLAGAYEEALDQFRQAHALRSEPVAQAALQGKQGDVAFKCGNQGEARTAIEGALRQLGARVPRTRAGLVVALAWEVAVQALHTLLPRLLVGRRDPEGADRELLSVRLYSRLAYVYWFHSGRLRCGWAHLREMNLAERYTPTRELAQAYSEHAPVMTMLPWYCRGITYAERSLAIRVDLGDVWGQGQSLGFHAAVLYSASRYQEAVDKSRHAIRTLERTGDRWEANTARWHLALALYRLGELGHAAEEARQLYESASEIGDQTAAGISLSAWARASEGRVPGPLVHAHLARDDEDAHTATEVHMAEAVRLLATVDPAGAASVLQRAREIVRRAGLRQEYVAPVLPWLATALRQGVEGERAYATDRRRARLREAGRVARRAERVARSYRNSRQHALRERGLTAALGGRPRRARRWLTASIDTAQSQWSRFEEAQSLVARGRVGTALGWETARADVSVGASLLAALRSTRRDEATDTGPTLSLADRFATLLEAGRAIAAASTTEGVHDAVRRAAADLLRGERCHLFELTDDLDVDDAAAGAVLDELSRTVVRRAVEARRPVVADPGRGLDATDSLELSGARSVICAPILCDGRPTACFYVTHARVGGLFGAEEVQLASFIATLAGAALEHVAGSEARFRSLAQNSSDVITIVEEHRRVVYQSSSVARTFGYEPGALTGSRLDDWIHPDDREQVLAAIQDALAEDDGGVLLSCRLRAADGSWRHTESTFTDLFDDPSVRGAVLNTRDVSERRALEDELRRLAWHDSLTGLPNRALFTDRVKHSLVRGEREGAESVVLFLDLDEFKTVNDTMGGHAAGDVLLREVAERLAGCVRPGDTVGRFGGDEFAVLLEGASVDDAVLVADRIVAEMARAFNLLGREVHVSASVGIAAWRSGSETAEELLGNADAAMFAAKSRGKDRYEVFAPHMRTAALERSLLRRELETALEHDELQVFYQPLVSLTAGRMVGAEALLRWQNPRRGLIGPDEFIPLAEETRLIVPIGSWVLRRACRQARAWQDAFPSPEGFGVSVNVSPRQLRDAGFVDDVAAALLETGLDPGRLTLEITESVMVDDTDVMVQRMSELKDLGVRLSIDDFGTGYSSLSYLTRFPVSVLKIDQSFVAGLAEGRTDAATVVTGIAGLAHALNMEVVAEGVENLGQLEILRSLECDVAQGFNWSPPVLPEALKRWLQISAGSGPALRVEPLRILLVDDQAHVRHAVALALEESERYRVVAEADSAESAVEMAAMHQPDLVLLDVVMPGTSGLKVIPDISAAAPGALVVLLTTADDMDGSDVAPVIDKARHLDHLVDLLGSMTGVP